MRNRIQWMTFAHFRIVVLPRRLPNSQSPMTHRPERATSFPATSNENRRAGFLAKWMQPWLTLQNNKNNSKSDSVLISLKVDRREFVPSLHGVSSRTKIDPLALALAIQSSTPAQRKMAIKQTWRWAKEKNGAATSNVVRKTRDILQQFLYSTAN